MSVWAQYRDDAKAAGGSGGLFVKLDDGESVHLIVLDEPMTRYRRWTGTGYEDASVSERGQKGVQQVYLLNVYDCEARAARIWELNGPTFVELSDVLADSAEPLAELLQVKRNGTGPKTRYSIRPRGRAKADTLATARDSSYHDLSEHGGVPITAQPAAAAPQDADIPF